jgi:hypothetical protein
MILKELGIERGRICEILLSTYNDDGSPTAAPMGIRTYDFRHLIIEPYATTLTYKNLCSRKCAVANVTDDPELFYDTAFKKGKLPKEWFEKAVTVDAPRMKASYSFLELSLISIAKRGDMATITCEVKLAEIRPSYVRPYCRATFATIESIIHATRVKEFLKDGAIDEADKLIRLIEHYHAIVKRTNPNSSCERIMDELTLKINSWMEGCV